MPINEFAILFGLSHVNEEPRIEATDPDLKL